MIKKINYKHGELRKELRYFFCKRITPDNYVVSRSKAWRISVYNKNFDEWRDVTIFATEENADKYMSMVLLNSDLFYDATVGRLRTYAYSLFKDS
mgnify:CR=1 FL=1